MNWGDKRYHSLNYFLREKFKCKVYKIPLDAGFSCPNRDGTVSFGGCIFCGESGSGDFAGDRLLSIHEQFDAIKKIMNKKWKNGKYIAYFQAYTNTYAPIEVLRQKYSEAIREEGVVALAIATRPDCLEEEVLDLLSEIKEKIYLWIELGFQTSNDKTAEIINRGYKKDVFEDAVRRLGNRGIDVVCHVIFGLPGESHEDMIETVKYISKFGLQGIKFHMLYLLKNTPLEKLYNDGVLKFMDEEEYVGLICRAISILPPEMIVHRLTGDAPRELLIGPLWSLKKWEVLNLIDKTLEKENLYQGKYFKSQITD